MKIFLIMKKICLILIVFPLFANGQDFRVNNNVYEENGLTLSQNTSFSKNSAWIGVDLSLVGFLSEASVEGEKTTSVAIEVLTFGWSRRIDHSNLNKSNNFDFNLIRFGSPLTISLLKFGCLDDFNNDLYWYYKPEIGLGFGDFDVFYSYNLFFKEIDKNLHEKHMINFRFSKKLSSLYLSKLFKQESK